MNIELQFLLILSIIIAACKLAGHLSQRYLNQPIVFGEILAGLIFGPTLLNLFGWPIFRGSSTELQHTVDLLARLGVLLLMFVAGLETDLEKMKKVGTTAFWSALGGVVLPLVLGALVARLFGTSLQEAIFIGAVFTATSVSISAQTLMEIGQLKSRQGMTILGAAVIDDVMGIIVLSFVLAFGTSHVALAGQPEAGTRLANLLSGFLAPLLQFVRADILQIVLVVVLMGIFLGLAVIVGKRFGAIFDRIEHLHASHVVPAAALVLVFLFAVGAEYLGQVAAITGAYLAGIFIARTRFRQEIEHSLHPFTYALFVPVFFMSIGLGVNARDLGGNLLFTAVLVVVAIVTKAIGCGIGARASGFTSRESLQVGIGMISRGEVGLIVAQVGKDAGIIETPVYAAMVIMVLASTIVTPILLRLVFPRVKEIEKDVYESVVEVESAGDE